MKIELNRVLRQNYILKSKCSNYNENNMLLSQQIKDMEEQLNSTTKLIESQLYEVQRLEVANSKQQTWLIAQLQHLQTECNILSSYKNIIGEILRRSPENILQVQSCTESQQEQHHNSIYNQSDYQPRDSNSIPVKQHLIDFTFQKKRLLAFRQILKEECFSLDAKTDDEINQFVCKMPKTNNFWVRVGQMCEIDSKKLRENFNSQYKLIKTNGQNSTESNENEQTENCDQVILENHLQTIQNQNESNYHLNEQENRQASYSCKSQINRANMNEQQQIISERDLIEQFTQAFQLILKEAGYTINGDGQLWIWQAVKSLSTQQRNQLKLWDQVVQICKLRDNKVAQQFFKQQCRKLQALQNETNDHSLFQDDRSQQELDKQNSGDIDLALDLAQLSQDQVCCQDKPNEIESIQCQEEIQGITREGQVQLPDTQIVQAQPKLTENLIQAEQHESEVKAQESQPVLENELEPEINIQTGILEQKARDLKTQIQIAITKFQDQQHKLKLAHETVKQLTAQSDMSVSQSTTKENIETVGVQIKNDDCLPHSFEQPGQQHGDRKELLEQEIQHLQKQLELANKKVRNEQYKLNLVNETIANLICQNQQKTSEQNTLEAQQVSCVQQESVQKDIQESCSLSHQNLANDSHLSTQNQKSNLETSFNQLEPVPCDHQGNFMHNSNSHTEPSQLDHLTSNNVQQPSQPQIQLAHQDDVLNESSQQGSSKQLSKQYSSQQLLLRLAVKQTLKEAGYEVESLSEKEICKTVHKLTSKEKRQLRFWDRVAQLCCRSKLQIVHFYRQTYKSSVYKNKLNQRVQVDNQEQYVSQQSDIQNSQMANTTLKDGKVIIRKKRVRVSQIGSQLMSFALRQVLTEIGIQVTETASDKDLCLQIDQISNIQKRQLKFWDRVSVLCQLSKQQVFTFYSRIYKPNIYTDKLNENDRAAIDEYIRQNLVVIQEASIYETAIQVMNSYFKDRGISLLDIKQYIGLNKSVIPNPSKLLTRALKQVLKEEGHQVETATDKEICNHVDQISIKLKKQYSFWERVSVLCQKSKDHVQSQYFRYKLHIFTDLLHDNQKAQKVNTTQKAGEAVTRKRKVRASQICPQLMSFALRQVLTEIGYPVETASDKEICNHVDQISFSQKMQYKFWDRISVLCQQSKGNVKQFYYVTYKTNIFTERLNNNDKAVIDEYISQNQIMNILETTTTIMNTYFKDRSISMLDIKQHIFKQSRNDDFNQKINRSKLLSCALKQILKEDGYQIENLSNKEICLYVDQIPYIQKIKVKFWDRISVLCQRSKEQTKTLYYTTYKTTILTDQLNDNNNNETTIQNAYQIQSKLLTDSLKQILKEDGYQVESASDKELYLFTNQLSKSNKLKLNFWDRISVLCQKSKQFTQDMYQKVTNNKKHFKLNDSDKAAIEEHIRQNKIVNINETVLQIMNTCFQNRNMNMFDVQKYIQKQFEQQKIMNTFQNQTYNQLNGQSNINDQTNNVIGQIATKSSGNHEYRFKLLSLALKQILIEDGYLAETASGNELCLLVDQMPQNDKILLNFWDRVSVLCQQSKETVKRFYYTTYKSANHQQNYKVGTDKCLNSEQNISNIAKLQDLSQKLTSAFKVILREEDLILDDATDDEIRLAVKNITWEQKQRLNFWERTALICQVEVVKLQLFYSELYTNVIQLNIKSQRVTNKQQTQKAEKFRKIDLKTIRSQDHNLTFALKQILKQEGFQIQTSSARELCVHIDKIPESQIIKLKFWNRVSKLCNKSEFQVQKYYQSVYKQCIFTSQQHNDVEPTVTQQLETNNGNQQNENIQSNEAVTEQQNVQSAQNIQTQTQHCEAQRVVSTSDCQNTKSSEETTSAYSHQILLEQQSDAKTKLDRSEALNQIQPEIGSQQANETQKELAVMELAVMEQESNVIDISQDNVNPSMKQIQPKQIVETNADKHKPYTEQNQEQNKPLTQNNVQPQKLKPCIQSKLMQQIPLALKKVLSDSGYNVKDATEKELCALVMFMTNKQKTEIDLWNRAAQICEINKTQLYKFYQYQYSTVLYSHGKDDNGVINNQKDTTAIYQNDTMSNQQQRSKDNEINNDQNMNTKQSLCQKNIHAMSNSLPTISLEAMRESVDALVPKFVPAIPQSIISDESIIQNTQNSVQQVHQILPSLNINTVANTLVPNFVPSLPNTITKKNIENTEVISISESSITNTIINPIIFYTNQCTNKPREYTNSECKLIQQIPLALKKVLTDSGYNIKKTPEKELYTLVMFMNFRQITKIDLWNRVAKLCDVDKAELQKFFNYHYNTLYSENGAQNKPYAQ
ncbi:Hypothetical_protein [Hexamita inflata]|uniref:Hypothetical_protein n=1 Tax=Hexamita inflata TaxID=28002 RepID=A0AA86VGB6_9EUKA|nr:Hypothetical protein HINF_LOCUS53508 [Hexamita inflata]